MQAILNSSNLILTLSGLKIPLQKLSAEENRLPAQRKVTADSSFRVLFNPYPATHKWKYAPDLRSRRLDAAALTG